MKMGRAVRVWREGRGRGGSGLGLVVLGGLRGVAREWRWGGGCRVGALGLACWWGVALVRTPAVFSGLGCSIGGAWQITRDKEVQLVDGLECALAIGMDAVLSTEFGEGSKAMSQDLCYQGEWESVRARPGLGVGVFMHERWQDRWTRVQSATNLSEYSVLFAGSGAIQKIVKGILCTTCRI